MSTLTRPPQTSATRKSRPEPERVETTTRQPMGSKVTVNTLLILGSAYMILPITWLLFASTKSVDELYGLNALSFGGALIDNVVAVSTQDNGLFYRWILNSFLYAGVGAVFGGLISVMAGYAFDKFRFRFKNQLFAFVLVGVLIPNTATVLPLYLLASTVNATNTIWAMILPALCNPFSVYLARVFSASYIPDETLEAARVDGAGSIRSFISISLPMIMPGFITIALFQFVNVWNNYMLPLVMLSSQELFPVSLGMATWQGYTTLLPDYVPMVITGSLLSIIPLIAAFIMLQRFWKAGLSAGSIK
ncbi:multiple sugar transport system permease protein [Arthrobacter pigmenti]|uniref:Multiple sugar transport system permease protein n=1 Tax=Arthrobacter pigmenti TaxID=271432 RepID=A0A846RIX0_9MICC|nr:carbohydrate ABC transporter permease [Arthrobacter pigmenti]NJC21620.1 multiple sugar transport system permease protein [Arthrobacter pigmenti]